MTYEEIRSYVSYEAREAERRNVGSYESSPFAAWKGRDDKGEDIIEDDTCTVSVHLLGDDSSGYILTTSDHADGPADGMGQEVYSTVDDAIADMQARGADIIEPDFSGMRTGGAHWQRP